MVNIASNSPADKAACDALYAAGLKGLPWWEAPTLAEEVASDPCDPAIYDRLIEAHRAGACERARRAVATAVEGMRTPCDPFLPWQGEVDPNWLEPADATELVDIELTQYDAESLIEVAAEAADIPADDIVSIVGEFCPLPANAPRLAEWALTDYQRIPARRQVPGTARDPLETHREFVEMYKSVRRRKRREELAPELITLWGASRLSLQRADAGVANEPQEAAPLTATSPVTTAPSEPSPDFITPAQALAEADRTLNLRRQEQGLPALRFPPRIIAPTPFALRDPTEIPRREWLYARHLIRREIALTLAPGGVGKTSLGMAEAMAMATGRKLLHDDVRAPLRVWVYNGEEPADEMERRLAALAIHYGIRQSDIEGRLFIDNVLGREAAAENGQQVSLRRL